MSANEESAFRRHSLDKLADAISGLDQVVAACQGYGLNNYQNPEAAKLELNQRYNESLLCIAILRAALADIPNLGTFAKCLTPLLSQLDWLRRTSPVLAKAAERAVQGFCTADCQATGGQTGATPSGQEAAGVSGSAVAGGDESASLGAQAHVLVAAVAPAWLLLFDALHTAVARVAASDSPALQAPSEPLQVNDGLHGSDGSCAVYVVSAKQCACAGAHGNWLAS